MHHFTILSSQIRLWSDGRYERTSGLI